MPLYSCCPLTGPFTLWEKFDLPLYPLPTDFWCMGQSPFYSADLCLLNSLCTRSDDSHICILNWRVARKSSDCFSLWGTPWIVLHFNWAECSPAHGYDPRMPVLLSFLPLFARIIFAIFAFYPLLLSHALPVSDILVQIQCSTGFSILNPQGAGSVIICFCLSLLALPFASKCRLHTCIYFS